MFTFRSGFVKRGFRCEGIPEWMSLIRAQRQLESIHVAADWKRWLVFDVDLRDAEGDANKKNTYKHRKCVSEHRDIDICPRCWPIAQIAEIILDEIVTKGLGLSPPLLIFSGNGGLHAWYRLRDDDMSQSSAFTSEATREFLIVLLATPLTTSPTLAARILSIFPALTMEELLRIMPTFDRKPTCEHKHMLRSPFSLNPKSGCYALPIGIGGSIALLPYPKTTASESFHSIATSAKIMEHWTRSFVLI